MSIYLVFFNVTLVEHTWSSNMRFWRYNRVTHVHKIKNRIHAADGRSRYRWSVNVEEKYFTSYHMEVYLVRKMTRVDNSSTDIVVCYDKHLGSTNWTGHERRKTGEPALYFWLSFYKIIVMPISRVDPWILDISSSMYSSDHLQQTWQLNCTSSYTDRILIRAKWIRLYRGKTLYYRSS